MARSQLGEELGEAETDAILAFLGSLEGRVPEVVLPVLPGETALTPHPAPPLREE